MARIFRSFAEADQADVLYYQSLTPEQRLDILGELIALAQPDEAKQRLLDYLNSNRKTFAHPKRWFNWVVRRTGLIFSRPSRRFRLRRRGKPKSKRDSTVCRSGSSTATCWCETSWPPLVRRIWPMRNGLAARNRTLDEFTALSAVGAKNFVVLPDDTFKLRSGATSLAKGWNMSPRRGSGF